MLMTRSPRAVVSAGNRRTLATVASFGLKPCCTACFQKALKLERSAPPSESFGYISATTLLVFIFCHMGKKQPANSCRPKKNMVVYLKGLVAVAPRPKNQDSQGTMVATQGTPLASQRLATGLVTSGVDAHSTISTPALISSWVTVPARV